MHPELQSASVFLFMAIGATNGPELNSNDNELKTAIQKLRVLIVEDEGLVAMNMDIALTDAGFTVLGIVDTESDAIASAIRQQPDVIIMDITLREGDGISAAKAICKTFSPRIVFVSGNSDPATLKSVEAEKPAGFIRKPFVTDRFASLVLAAIGRSSN